MKNDAIKLDGEWAFLPLESSPDASGDSHRPPPADGFEPTPILVPGYWNTFPPEVGGDWGAYDHYGYPEHWQNSPAAWYRQPFAVPPSASAESTGESTKRIGDRWFLCFDAVAGHAHVLLNGKTIGDNADSFLPFEFDVTEHVRCGDENELHVLVNPPPKKDGLWLNPCGSWVGWYMRGIWQPVRLERRPAIRIADVFVQPSVRKKMLTVEVTLAAVGLGGEVEVELKIEDGDQIALDFGRKKVKLTGAETVVKFERGWSDARYWCPDDPHLYHAMAALSFDGKSIDMRRARFGFREFWIEGTGFRLNGEPMLLLGDSWHYMGVVQQNPAYARTWYEFAKHAGVNVIRTHAMPYPPFYFDIADEMGVMIIDESAIYGSAGTLAYDEPVFWENCRDHIRRLVRRDRNHPSIIFWSACNETVWKGGEAIFEPLAELGREAKRFDPTRFTSYDENDSDLGGRSPVYSGHYGTPEHWDRVWKRDKPLIIHEFSALYHGGPEAACPIGGDRVYDSFQARLEATGQDAADMFLKLRQMGAASITPWNLNWYCLMPIPWKPVEAIDPSVTEGGAPIRRIGDYSVTFNYGFTDEWRRWEPNWALEYLSECYKRQRFYLPILPREGYGGDAFRAEIEYWNDKHKELDVTLQLKIEATVDDRREILSHVEYSVPLSAHQRLTSELVFQFPIVDRATAAWATLSLVDTSDDHELHTQRWQINICPALADHYPGIEGPLYQGRRKSLLACENTISEVCARALRINKQVEKEALEKCPLSADTTVILESSAGDLRLHEWLVRQDIDEWLRSGGRLIVLPDAMCDDTMYTLAPIHRHASRVFSCDHEENGLLREPLGGSYFDGIKGIATRMIFERPTTGPAWAPLDTGDPADGMGYSPLVIAQHGRGHVIYCGMDLLRNADQSPFSATLLGRLVHEDLPVTSDIAASVIGSAEFASHSLFDDSGIITGDSDKVLIIDASDEDALASSRAIAQRLDTVLQNGGTLVLDNLTPPTVSGWNSLLDLDVRVIDCTRYNVSLSSHSHSIRGINNYDLCWVLRGEKQAIIRHPLIARNSSPLYFVDTYVSASGTRWENYQHAAEQHKVGMMFRRMFSCSKDPSIEDPAALVAIRRGRGTIIINQLLLREAKGPFRSRALRIFSRLMDGLGVARDERVSPLAPQEDRGVDGDGYITRWLVAGPFSIDAGHPLDHPVVDECKMQPTEGAAAGDRVWSVLSSPHVQIDLAAHWPDAPASDRVAYAAAYVYSSQDRSVLLDAPDMIELRTAADGGTKSFLNGEQLGRFDFVRELVLDSDRMGGVPLRRGWNLLVVKLHNRGGAWRFAARLLTSSGVVASDLQFSASKPDDAS